MNWNVGAIPSVALSQGYDETLMCVSNVCLFSAPS
jgi:hypothetical protein